MFSALVRLATELVFCGCTGSYVITHAKRLTLKKNTEIHLLVTDEKSFCGMSLLILHVSVMMPHIHLVYKRGGLLIIAPRTEGFLSL